MKEKIMNYEVELPQKFVASAYVSNWDLGDVYMTKGVVELLENMGPLEEDCEDEDGDDEIIEILKLHLEGDYGIVRNDAKDFERMSQARREGRAFTGIYPFGGTFVKVVTYPGLVRTVVCSIREN